MRIRILLSLFDRGEATSFGAPPDLEGLSHKATPPFRGSGPSHQGVPPVGGIRPTELI
jgi:hypothetical protein